MKFKLMAVDDLLSYHAFFGDLILLKYIWLVCIFLPVAAYVADAPNLLSKLLFVNLVVCHVDFVASVFWVWEAIPFLIVAVPFEAEIFRIFLILFFFTEWFVYPAINNFLWHVFILLEQSSAIDLQF